MVPSWEYPLVLTRSNDQEKSISSSRMWFRIIARSLTVPNDQAALCSQVLASDFTKILFYLFHFDFTNRKHTVGWSVSFEGYIIMDRVILLIEWLFVTCLPLDKIGILDITWLDCLILFEMTRSYIRIMTFYWRNIENFPLMTVCEKGHLFSHSKIFIVISTN